MNINMLELITKRKDEIIINEDIIINDELLKETSIKKLDNVIFDGKIERIMEDEYCLNGTLSGIMILPDDITLEDVEYKFSTEIDEYFTDNDEKSENILKIMQNTIDILPILWQNIIVEIPLKVTTSEGVDLKGDGWRLISEEEFEKERSHNSPFSNLEELLNEGKE